MARIPHGTGNSLQPTGAVRRMTRPVRWEEMAPHELRRAARTDMGSVPNNVACDERVIAPLGDTRTLAALAAPRLSAWQERKAEELMSHYLSGSADVQETARSCRISRRSFVSAFQVSAGITTHQWLTRSPRQRAPELLLSTETGAHPR